MRLFSLEYSRLTGRWFFHIIDGDEPEFRQGLHGPVQGVSRLHGPGNLCRSLFPESRLREGEKHGSAILKNPQAIQAEQICRSPEEVKAVRDGYNKRMKEAKK